MKATHLEIEELHENNHMGTNHSDKILVFDSYSGEIIIEKRSESNCTSHNYPNLINLEHHLSEMQRGTFF